jgi:para-aminobenzoate synthetase component 2
MARLRRLEKAETMVLLIDNYDSFTYNLAQYFGELGCDVVVKRNDEISIDEIAAMAPEHICVSPGPCTPREAGISKEVILRFGDQIPILGVCLGHQCIAEAYGGTVVRAERLMHGKSCMISHNGSTLFSDLSNPFEGGRYHSLVVERTLFPACLEITAESGDGEIMALRHRELPVQGVQFHPESVLTRDGKKILARFLALAPKTWLTRHKSIRV